MPRRTLVLAILSLLAAPLPMHADPAPSAAELTRLLETIDDRQRNSGDWRSEVLIEEKARGKPDAVFEALVFRRSADAKFAFLFTNPKASAGEGYLRLEGNLWFYDPRVGKWERRTERERFGGTGARRSDFDDSRLAEEYTPAFVGKEKLGAFDTTVLKLTSKPGIDVAFPIVQLWADDKTKNVLKRQEFAASGRLLRTTYYPKWGQHFSDVRKANVWFPQEIRFFDEVEKGTSTMVVVKNVTFAALPANTFTKAWLEGQSR